LAATPISQGSGSITITLTDTQLLLWSTNTAGVYAASLYFGGLTADATVRWLLTFEGSSSVLWSTVVPAGDLGLLTPPIPIVREGWIQVVVPSDTVGTLRWEVISA
jgi:hypothetical protein